MTVAPPRRAAGTGSSVVVERCQSCGAPDLVPVIFVGFLPPVNRMRAIGAPLSEEPAYPAQLLRCPRCELVQLGLVVDPAILFPPDYPYTSGTTRILRENFARLAAQASALLDLRPDDLIVDVGSNDGTLLGNFARSGHRVRGIEPTDTGEIADAGGIPTLRAFFGDEAVRTILREDGPARIVTAANVFAHIEDVHAVLEGITRLLRPDGVFISESHYWIALLERLQYDTIYHEHLRYYSLTSLQALMAPHGLQVCMAERIPTHGGSIRVYAARPGTMAVDVGVERMLAAERTAQDPGALARFSEGVVRSKLGLYRLLADAKDRGERIDGIGAPSRATTLVRYVGLDDGLLDRVLEVSTSRKLGKYMPGTVIPVVDEARLFDDPPDQALLLSWHIADELIAVLRRRGYRGSFIVPLPEPRIVG
jgi:hypothetical protein